MYPCTQIETDTAAGPVTPTAIALTPAIGALSNMSIVFEPRKVSLVSWLFTS